MTYTLSNNTQSEFPPFAELIERYCDRNPKERSKFICPVCEGGNLSVNMKDGKWNCFSDPSPEHRQAIADRLNERYKADNPLPSNGNGGGFVPSKKPKTDRQRLQEERRAKDALAAQKLSEVEQKCVELAYGFDGDNAAQLELELVTWAKAHGHDAFAAKGLLKQKLTIAQVKQPEVGLADKIRTVLLSTQSQSELAIAKMRLRTESGASVAEFEKIWALMEAECDPDPQAIDQRNIEIDRLLKAKQSSLRAREIVSPKVAQAIEQHSQWMNLREECYFSAYMTGIGSVAKNGTYLRANEYTMFDVSPNFYTIIVAESSQRKSPIIKSVLSRPLRSLQKELIEQYEYEHQRWEEDKEAASKAKEPFNAKEPQKPVIYVTQHTGEAVLAQASRTPDYGICIVSDEVAGYFKSANQYRGGAGGDKESLLSYYDGEGGAVLRVSGLRDYVETLNLGIVGAIQPAVLQKFLGDCDDSNGNWARFSFIQQPIAIARLPKRGEGHQAIDISGIVAEIFKRVNSFAPQAYTFTTRADDYFVEVAYRCEKRRETESAMAMRSVWGKLPGRIAKYALNLHLEHAAANGEAQPCEFIDLPILKRAIKKAFLDLQQIQSLYNDFDEEAIASPLAKVVELSKKRGTLKARDVLQTIDSKKRPSPDVVRDWFVQLSEQGWGELIGSGVKTAFKAFSDRRSLETVEAVEAVENGSSTAGSFDTKGFCNSVESVEKQRYLIQDQELDSDDDPGKDHDSDFDIEAEKRLIQEIRQNSSTSSTASTESQNHCSTRDSAVEDAVESASTASTVFQVGDEVEVVSSDRVLPTGRKMNGLNGVVEEVKEEEGDRKYKVRNNPIGCPELLLNDWFSAQELKSYKRPRWHTWEPQ